jgi:AraC-like DNA-binding protein
MTPKADIQTYKRFRCSWKPCAQLRPYVLAFELRDDSLGDAQIFNPLPARSDCFLQFHFGQPYSVVNTSTGEAHRASTRVLVGPHSVRREDLIWTGDLVVFTIRFSPVGFRSIFGIPAYAICDTASSAEVLLGAPVISFEERLAQSKRDQMPSIAEEFLLSRLASSGGFSRAASVQRLTDSLKPGSAGSLREIAENHGLSLRQVERLFQEFVGVSPRHFECLQRSKLALSLRRSRSNWGWSEIAAASGYFDQAHMIREFRSLNGSTPERFARTGLLAHEFRAGASVSGVAERTMSPPYNLLGDGKR